MVVRSFVAGVQKIFPWKPSFTKFWYEAAMINMRMRRIRKLIAVDQIPSRGS